MSKSTQVERCVNCGAVLSSDEIQAYGVWCEACANKEHESLIVKHPNSIHANSVYYHG